jgi:fatty-acyl-CoA synthase
MRGLMMDAPLMISSIIEHADAVYGDQEVVSRTVEGPIVRASYREVHQRSRQLANALAALGLNQGDRVGSIAWNTQRHLELYFGVSGAGLVLHVMNPRLPPPQIAYVVNHAEDRALFVDLTFMPLVEALKQHMPKLDHVVVMTDRAHMPDSKIADLICYEELIHGHSDAYDWPRFDENTAAAMCYTSGTTGNPKGVLYSHRSTVLHAMVCAQAGVSCLSEDDVVLPVVPMFHAMAWGYPYSSPMTGAKLVMPGPGLDGKSLFTLMDAEKVTSAAGVPTIWFMLLAEMKAAGRAPEGLVRTLIGGSAVPEAMIDAFDKFGVEVRQGWGMTETSPVASISLLKPKMRSWPAERRHRIQAKQGRKLFAVDLAVVDDDGRPQPHDGQAFGPLRTRGPWICSAYYKPEKGAEQQGGSHVDGWLDTGDIATMDEEGYIQITDRKKDLIKSGGEWISSIEVENLAVAHPDIAQAAVIAKADKKWGERPLLIAVAAAGKKPDKAAILKHLGKGLAKWQVPEEVVFVDTLPLGATGKVLKTKLREEYGG